MDVELLLAGKAKFFQGYDCAIEKIFEAAGGGQGSSFTELALPCSSLYGAHLPDYLK